LFAAGFTYPIGPIPLRVEVDATGFWGVFGELSTGYSRGVLGAPSANVTARVTPKMGVDAHAFVGVGFDLGVFSAKAGFQGSINLVTADLPLDVTAQLSRGAQQSDSRLATLATVGTTGLDGLGGPENIADLSTFPFGQPGRFDWALDWRIRQRAIFSFLNGEIDARVRVKFLFFSKTWKKRLAKWAGIQAEPFELVSDGAGGPLVPGPGEEDMGTAEEDIPFVGIAPNSTITTLVPATPLPSGWNIAALGVNGCFTPPIP
jgi:hypothetical protein